MATEQTPPDAGDDPGKNADKDAAERIRDSAQQIWLAGLGAFAKAQQEGSKVFESLVKEGASMQQKTQQSAGDVFAQIQARMTEFASEFGSRAADQWGKFEGVFEERVARVLRKLGMPSAAELDALRERVAALESRLAQRDASQGAATAHTARRDDPAA